MSLQLHNVAKSFGSLDVLQGIDLDIAPGSVTAIVGDNGAGKSTLLKIMARNLAPDAGTLASIGSIEMVFQDLALAPQQDVTANLFLGREICGPFGFLRRGVMRAKAAEALKALGITIASLDTPVGKLSGGQRQAVAIARALMFNPKILILDEPTAALAAREVQMVLDLIRAQKKAGLTVILVSHRLNDVLEVADRIVTLKHGKIFRDRAMPGVTLAQIVQDITS
jgi:simple sugar transport system ATP-binding protein